MCVLCVCCGVVWENESVGRVVKVVWAFLVYYGSVLVVVMELYQR